MTAEDRPRVREAPFGFTITQVPGVQEALKAFSAAIWSEDGEVSPILKEYIFLRTSIVNNCEG